jgi:AcrR family transcriptional regulator
MGIQKPKKSNRSGDMLRAAERLMATRGLTGVTTRQLSKEIGCSEGALYVHFKNRLELLLAMLEKILPDMVEPLQRLHASTGQGDVSANLLSAVNGIYAFQARAAPLFAGLFAEPTLLEAYRKSLVSQNKGPHLSMGALSSYIRAEQKQGRIGKRVDADLSASLLLSACFFRAFTENFFAKSLQPPWKQYAPQLVAFAIGGAQKRKSVKAAVQAG